VAGLRDLARFFLRPQYRGEVLHDWQRRRAGEPQLPRVVHRVLVVCHGNICRSPFAEALLRSRCRSLTVRSAGFAAGEGGPADATAIEIAREWGIDLEPHRAHLLRNADLDWAQLVLVMTQTQVQEARTRGSEEHGARVRVLGDYLPDPPFAIDDPFGLPKDVFRSCFERIDQATARLSALLER
jgi:protein-tyrosine phosphatase